MKLLIRHHCEIRGVVRAQRREVGLTASPAREKVPARDRSSVAPLLPQDAPCAHRDASSPTSQGHARHARAFAGREAPETSASSTARDLWEIKVEIKHLDQVENFIYVIFILVYFILNICILNFPVGKSWRRVFGLIILPLTAAGLQS